jgi:hypothetical protein
MLRGDGHARAEARLRPSVIEAEAGFSRIDREATKLRSYTFTQLVKKSSGWLHGFPITICGRDPAIVCGRATDASAPKLLVAKVWVTRLLELTKSFILSRFPEEIVQGE